MFKAIKAGKYRFESPHWDMISPTAKSFVSRMLVVYPSKRYEMIISDTILIFMFIRATAVELLQDPWFSTTEAAIPLTAAMRELRSLNTRRSLKAAMQTVHDYEFHVLLFLFLLI